MLPPNDRLLRAVAEHQLERAEQHVETAVITAMRGWLAAVQAVIVNELQNLVAAAWPASRAVDAANQSYAAWRAGLDAHLLPSVAIVLGEAFQRVRRTTPGSSFGPQQEYLRTVSDRLRIWPEGVFEEIRPELLEAMSDADTIEEITDRIGRVLNIDASTRDLRAQIGDIDERLTNPDLDPARSADLKARRRALWNAHDHEMNQWRWKARRIARTEAHGAVQYGQLAAARQAEAETGDTYYKRWLATEDTRTRPSHVVADGQMVRIDEKFRVGGFLLDHPGDPITIAPHETINCRCSMVILDVDAMQDELSGPKGSLGQVIPGGRRVGVDDVDDAHAAAEQVAADRKQAAPARQRGEDHGQTVPQVTPVDLPTQPERPIVDVPDDLTTLSDDDLIELMIAADNANNDALFEQIDAEFERRFNSPGDGPPDPPDADDVVFKGAGDDDDYRPARFHSFDHWRDLDAASPPRPDDERELGYIFTEQGWDGPITELDDDEFDAMVAASSEPSVFRGVKPIDGATAQEIQRAFIDEDSPWIGGGVNGGGWYASTAIETAKVYAGLYGSPGDDRSEVGKSIIELAFRPAAKIIDLANIRGGQNRDKSRIAAQLGYDVARVPSPRLGEFYYIVLNRSAVVVRRMQ